MGLAYIVDTPGFRMPTHAPQLDIDDPAGAQLDGSFGVAGVTDAFVEADCGLDLLLQLGVHVNVVPLQWLLDHEQAEFVQAAQVISIAQGVSRIGIDREMYARKLLSYGSDKVKVFTGFNFQLNPLVALANLRGDFFHQELWAFPYAQRDTAGDFLKSAAQKF